MRRSLVVLAMAVVFVLAMTSAAFAGNNKDHGTYAFGKGINYHCEMSYGQLVKAAKQSGHVVGPVSGAKAFALSSNGLALHCLDGED